MPWKIEHKCNMAQPGTSEYGVLKAVRDSKNVTVLKCDNPNCREEIVLQGHELFDEAVHTNRLGAGLPAGFMLPRSMRD